MGVGVGVGVGGEEENFCYFFLAKKKPLGRWPSGVVSVKEAKTDLKSGRRRKK